MRSVRETRYAVAAEGHHLAYQVVGDGPRDVLFVLQDRTPIDLVWDDPLAAHALGRLATTGRLILCDLRGWGASDAVPSEELPAMQAWTDDIGTVLDAVASERTALMASSEACLPAILFAATNPSRVASLTLINPVACFMRGKDTPWGMPAKAADSYLAQYRRSAGTGALVDLLAPSRAHDPIFRRWFARCERLSNGPGAAVAVYRRFMGTDLTGILPSIQAPTLVVRRRGDRHIRGGHAQQITASVPDARLVELQGDDDAWYAGDIDALFDEVERFLTGVRGSGMGTRVLSTVLFTDIVGSTDRAAALGDAAWTQVLAAHDALIGAHVGAFRGRLVKSTGDGALAVFDGPARAIQCAMGIARQAPTVGVQVRAGLHTGEIELRGDDVGGLAVHIGARVAALAPSGEVLVSGSVPPLVSGSGIAFEERGDHELKGVPGKWPLFAVRD